MLSKTELWDIFTGAKKPGMREGEADDAGLRAVAEAAVKDAVGGDEPVAWMYTLDNTEGIEENEPWVVFSENEEDPEFIFGTPGVDYSETFPVSTRALYTRPQASAAVPDWPVSDSELAGKIMTLLGHAVSPSLEPGADVMRDRIAAMLAASQPEVKS